MVKITREIWGRIKGNVIHRYIISNDELSVSVINFGATVQRIVYRGLDMIVSLPEAKLYDKFSFGCIGAVVGRYAGRIAEGKFSIDGTEFQLTRNHNGNHLHGGIHGLNKKIWNGEIMEKDDRNGVKFSMLSPDGDEGYPGNLSVSVTYSITDDNCLSVSYEAHSDRDTIINLTNHCYFNPNGMDNSPHNPNKPVETDNRNVEMTIFADRIVELKNEIPTGRLLPVDGTVFDFLSPRPLMRDTESTEGYDDTFVFIQHDIKQPVATAVGMKSGVKIECFTDQPAGQLFTMGNPGISFAFETQHFPDSPNHPEFPSTILKAGEIFRSTTAYKFSTVF